MGCGAVIGNLPPPIGYGHIPDRFCHPDDVTDALRLAGLKESQLIVGIDFTKSNLHGNHQPHGSESEALHEITKFDKNPYQQAFVMIADALAEFDTDQLFPVYGFGDAPTGSGYVFSFQPYDQPVHGLTAAVDRYAEIAKSAIPSGPTSFAPLIRQAILKVREAAAYSAPVFHILLILADGQVSQSAKLDTELAIEEASHYPLSIICVGLGDGPWETMYKYDDKLRRRVFDNFQFVEFNTVFIKYPYIRRKEAFAVHALQEVPEQYVACRRKGYFKDDWEMPKNFICPPRALGPPDCPNKGDPCYGVLEGWTAVWNFKEKAYFYMSKETGESLWDKPVLSIYKPPPPYVPSEDDDFVNPLWRDLADFD